MKCKKRRVVPNENPSNGLKSSGVTPNQLAAYSTNEIDRYRAYTGVATRLTMTNVKCSCSTYPISAWLFLQVITQWRRFGRWRFRCLLLALRIQYSKFIDGDSTHDSREQNLRSLLGLCDIEGKRSIARRRRSQVSAKTSRKLRLTSRKLAQTKLAVWSAASSIRSASLEGSGIKQLELEGVLVGSLAVAGCISCLMSPKGRKSE